MIVYNGIMLKNISKVMIGSAGVLAVGAVVTPHFFTSYDALAETTTFQVNVKEGLSVSVTTPDSSSWAAGGVNEFLRNKVSLSVTSNNASGFKASMYSKSTTNLANAADNTKTIPTLSGSTTRSAFPANRWGYSLSTTPTGSSVSYGETDAGNNSSNYYPLVSTSASPITLLSSATASTGSQNIYFGAKADMTQASGTYLGTVIISVVTGTINENSGNTDYNPTTPTDPASPVNDNPSDSSGTVAYNSGSTGVGISTESGSAPSAGGTRYSGTTAYTTTTSDGSAHTSTSVTEITGGDNRSAYTSPQGVTTSNINDGSSLSAALATTAAVAAASGAFFFIAAKRREDDDEEDEEES